MGISSSRSGVILSKKSLLRVVNTRIPYLPSKMPDSIRKRFVYDPIVGPVRASYVNLRLGLLNATIQATNAKIGHERFL